MQPSAAYSTIAGDGDRSILAIIVLYKTPASQSLSFSTLRTLLASDRELAAAIELMICDNTPHEQPRPASFHGVYLADTSNPGLARCYNQALRIAADRALPWLLLFDQDTTPTVEYLRELVAECNAQRSHMQIVAIVPKLLQNGVVQSPHRRPRLRHPRFDPALSGRVGGTLFPFNSASAIRVSALQAIGGFPEEFWLDFLDHATFHLLQRNGGEIFVLRSSLQHDLFANNAAKKTVAGRIRYQSILDAEHLFYNKFGSATDRIFLRIRLLRASLGQLIKRRHLGEALQALKAALRP